MYREVVNGKERELAETMEDFCPKCGEPLVWMASVRKYRACKCGKKGKKRG
jgi:ribosomal protein S27AE